MKKIRELQIGIEYLSQVISKGLTHPNYERVVKKAEKWKAIVTGEGLDPYMRQFHRRESKEMFDQRKELTQHIVQSVCKNIRDIEYKIPRSNSIKRVIALTDESKDASKLGNVLDSFWGTASLSDYFDTRWIELNDIDPNSFVVIEWDSQDNENPNPYPFEVSSEMAIDYGYINKILEYLIVKNDEMDGIYSYTLYTRGFSVKFIEMPNDSGISLGSKNLVIEMDGRKYIHLDNDKVYEVIIPNPHNFGQVPAFRVGYIRDQFTSGRTYLTPWWAAEPILMNILQAKSELDLTIALHTFPQKLQYVNRCSNVGCNGGIMLSGGKCSVCHGTGYNIITSAQEAILLPTPKNKEDMIDLENIIKYIYPPVDLIKFQDEYIRSLSARCLQAVYNSELYSRKEVAETATGKNIDLQAVYDTLYPMVVSMSIYWEWANKLIGKISGFGEIIASFTYGKDFKLKTLEDYLSDLKMNKDAGGASFINNSIEDDIARLLFGDDIKAFAKYLTIKRFFPFTGDSKEEILSKVNGEHVPKFYKVLYSCYGFIFDELEMEDPNFFVLAPAKQWDKIKVKIESIMTTMKEEEPKPPVFRAGFPGFQEGEEGTGGTGNQEGNEEESSTEEGDEEEGAEDSQ